MHACPIAFCEGIHFSVSDALLQLCQHLSILVAGPLPRYLGSCGARAPCNHMRLQGHSPKWLSENTHMVTGLQQFS